MPFRPIAISRIPDNLKIGSITQGTCGIFFTSTVICAVDQLKLKSYKTFIILFFLQAGITYAQLNPERHAVSQIKKGSWAAARKILDKSLKKDSLNMEALYVYAQLFLTPRYHQFNADSANVSLKKTRRLYQQCEPRTKERLKRFPLDSSILYQLKTKIDSAAFEKSKQENNEAGYQHFIKWYADAPQIKLAIELRDEAGFVLALKQNSHLAFREFLNKYPNGHRGAEARERFDKQLFQYSTKSKTLLEYRAFVSQNPTSPFVGEAMKNIFMMSTEDGTEKSLQDFIMQYPQNMYSQLSYQILFHLQYNNQTSLDWTDSLQAMYPLRDWLPFSENGKFGFMDENGKPTSPAIFSDINEEYFCTPLSEDFILTRTGIVGRNGTKIFSGYCKAVSDLGSGYLLVTTDSSTQIIHKSGWRPPLPLMEHATIIDSRFIAVKSKTRWGLFALNGNPILPFLYDKIIGHGKFMVLSRSGKEILVGLDNVISFAKGTVAPIVGDEIKSFGKNFCWLRNGSLEQILDEDLKEIIPFGRHRISYSSVGFVIVKDGTTQVKGWPALENHAYTSFQMTEPWLITKKEGEKASLFYVPTKKEIVVATDSIWFDQSLALVKENDSIRLWLSGSKSFSLPSTETYAIRKGVDSTVFLLLTSPLKTTVLRAGTFNKLFTAPYPEIKPVSATLFIFKDKGKEGLLNEKGKVILKAEYDALLFSNAFFSLLKDRQFGSYHPVTKKLIKPSFESNLKMYGQEWILARKNNKFGFLKPDGTIQTEFDFDEIDFWSDSVALVTIEGKLSLYAIARKKIIMQNMTWFEVIESVGHERLALFKQNDRYGVIRSASGVIIKPEFEEITHQMANGTLILTGIKPEVDDLVSVVQFLSSGKVIKSQVLSRPVGLSILCNN